MPRTIDAEGRHLASFVGLADPTGARVLEVGCGFGRLTTGLASRAASVLAVDPDEDAVDRARRDLPGALADRVEYRAGSPHELEIPRAAFDLVVFSWSY